MADAESAEKAKQEKLAAARKRFEQIKKDKARQAAEAAAAKKAESEAKSGEEAPSSSATTAEDSKTTEKAQESDSTTQAQQSKLRSASFRKTSVSGPLSPSIYPDGSGETAPEIYRKHVARIEELERENKKLAKDVADAEKRWQKAEEALADAGGGDGGDSGLVEKLKAEIAALQRQNAQLQSRASGSGATPSSPRHGSSPSMSFFSMLAAGGGSDGSGTAAADTSELAAQLASKTSTIEALELELSRLKARLAASPGGESAQEPRPHGSHEEQVAALEAKLARAERAAAQAQTELADARRNLERAGAAAVREGSARTSAETARAAAEREVANLTEQRDEALRKADALEKKVAALNAVHRDADARLQATRREKERAERTALELREKLELVEAEVARLRKKLGEAHAGLDDEGLEEVEAETENPIRRRLEARIRDLERENHELRRGVWSQKRHELDGLAGGATTGDDLGSPGAGKFIDVDLGGGNSSGVRSPVGGGGGGVVDGLGQLLTSGINALAGVNNTGRPSNGVDDDDGFLSDDDIDFDEEAFRRAQEEEARQRLERIRETKRALANWRGWRLDVATARRSSAQFGGMSSMGVGEVFEV